jgi:hypothetical protein
MDLPQRYPLAAAVVYVIDIPPSICGLMGQRDPHVQHPRPLDAPPRSAGAQAGPAVFFQRRRRGSQWLWMMAMFAFNCRVTTAASGVTATVGDDDIKSMGGGNAEMAIRFLLLLLYLGESTTIDRGIRDTGG